MKIIYLHCIVLLIAISLIACGKQSTLDSGTDNSAIGISLAPAVQDHDIDRVMVTIAGEGIEPMAQELGVEDRSAYGVFTVSRGVSIEVFAEAYDGDQLRYTGVKMVEIPPDSESVFVHILLESDEQHEPDEPDQPDEPDEPDIPEENVRFLVSTRAGLFFVNMDGSRELITEMTGPVEFYDNRILVLDREDQRPRIVQVDARGEIFENIFIPGSVPSLLDFVVLPNLNFALLDNSNDSIYFMDFQGEHLQTVKFLRAADDHLQSTDGVVVGNSLIFSEDGNNHLLEVNLRNYEAAVFRDLAELEGWLGAIDYSEGVYYICQAQNIYALMPGRPPRLVTRLNEGNITGIVVHHDFAYVTVNFSGKIYRVNLFTGRAEVFADGLDYPTDIELWYGSFRDIDEPRRFF